MQIETLLTQLKTTLEAHTAQHIYLSFDPLPFDTREAQFLVLEMESITLDKPFLTASHQCSAFTAQVRVTLLAPPNTNTAELYTVYSGAVLPGMLSAGAVIRELRWGTPTEVRQLHRMALHGSFTLSGIYQTEREGTGI